MLKEIDKDIWVAAQPLRYLGLSIGTRMTVIRLADQALAVISPIQVDDALKSQLNELGMIQHIIAPNRYHYLFAENCKIRYPEATLWAPPGLAAKRPSLSIDQTIDSSANGAWEGLAFMFFDGFRTLGLNGLDSFNEYIFFHAASRTLIVTDAAIYFDESFPFVTQLAARVLGGYKRLRPSLLERIATTEKESVRKSVEQVLSWDFERVIMAHGSIVEHNGKEKFRQGYEQFLG